MISPPSTPSKRSQNALAATCNDPRPLRGAFQTAVGRTEVRP
jgi:hypothetical protein